jgi:hypothetical protein
MIDRRGMRAHRAGPGGTAVSIRLKRLFRALPAGTATLAACAAAHVVGQCGNLLFQIVLARRFGLADYGEVGLAHLLFVLICFAGDLGYSSLFLRENPMEPGWSRLWRTALGHKLVAVLLLYGAAVAGWALTYGTHGSGFSYLVATLPAALFSVASLWPPLLAQGRRIAAFCVQQSPWPAALFLWMALAGEDLPASGIGMVVSAGFAVQLAASLAAWKRPADLLPRLAGGGRMLVAAFSLSAIGIAGVTHDRLTAFLVSLLAPRFLPIFLLLGHGLNGVSGVAGQVNRLLLPRIASGAGLRWSLGLAAAVLAGTALMLQVLLPILLVKDGEIAGLRPDLVMPTILAWGIATMSGFSAMEMIGRRREGSLARIVLIGIAVSAALQVVATIAASVDGVVWARALCALGIAAVSLRACGVSPAPAGLLLCGSAVACAVAPHALWLWPVSAVLLALAIIRIAAGGPVLVRLDASPS